MSEKRADIVIPNGIDPQTRMVFVQLLERVRQLERDMATVEYLIEKGVLRRSGGRVVAAVTPSK